MRLTLVSKQPEAGNVVTFRFKPESPLSWQAGQFMEYELVHDNPDSEGVKRWFTIASAPYEVEVQITTRITDSTFKQALNGLQVGDVIEADGKPDGDFVWQDSGKPIVWIAGGIGITPFHSILKQRVHANRSNPVTLLYANRTNEIVFQKELEQWSQNDSALNIHYPVGKQLNIDLIHEILGDVNSKRVYLSGPEPMVETLGDSLKENGLLEEQLLQDFFSGYNESNF